MSWTINRQPQFRDQPKDQLPGLGLRAVHRQAGRLSSRSRCASAPARKSAWSGCITSACRRSRSRNWRSTAPTPCPVMMPYIDRVLHAARLRRPPEGCARGRGELRFPRSVRRDCRAIPSSRPNIPCAPAWRPCIRCLNVDRGVPEVWGSVYDIRDLLNATVQAARRQKGDGNGCEPARETRL